MNIQDLLRAALGVAAVLMTASARAEVRVITTDTNLAAIARAVGGNRVTVESLSRGTDDPHHVEPRPSMVIKLSRADVFARVGMDLDMWADALLERCGNRKVQRGGPGYADCSVNVKVLEVPTTQLDPSMGDIHAYGNPHYLLDPANGIIAAGNIAAALIRVDPAGQAHYRSQYSAFAGDVRRGLDRWQRQMAPLQNTPIVVYHRTWIYFTKRFGLKEFGTVEPKPGVPPSPGYINGLIGRMKASGVRTVLSESFRDKRYPTKLAEATGARTVYVPVSVEAEPGVTDYIALFDRIVSRLAGRD
jgi:ABC-type Zn uptake system ZnuABC Zn-binding protein ZnuA